MSGSEPEQKSPRRTSQAEPDRSGPRIPRPVPPLSNASVGGGSAIFEASTEPPPDEANGLCGAASAPTSRPQGAARAEEGVSMPLEAGPAVAASAIEDEPEETTVGRVPEGLLAMSARPPPPSISFEEKTQSFVAPRELLELARRQTKAKSPSSPLGDELSPASTQAETPRAETLPTAAERSSEIASELNNGETVVGSPDPDVGRLPVDTVNTIEAPPVAATYSSIAPGLAEESQERTGDFGRGQPRSGAGPSLDSWLLAVCACILVGYWVSVLM